MSADSAVTYTSVHSEARSWSIPFEDPYEEAAQQLLERAPRSPEYVPNPIELEDHVPLHIPEHHEDLVPAEDEAPIEAYIPEVSSAPTPPLPPSFLSPCIRPPYTREAIAQMRAAVPSTYHSLLPLGTPPLLPIPLHVQSTSRRAEILEANTPPRKRLLLTALEMVNMRKDHAAVRAEIEVLRRETCLRAREPWRLEYALTHWRTLVAVPRLDYDCIYYAKMAPKRITRSTQVPPVTPALTTTTTTVTEAQLQDLINQGVVASMAEAEASRVRNSYDSNGSGPRLAQAVREWTYLDFLKCQPLNFKGTEAVVGLTQWFEKMESVFNISNCITITLEVAQALTWKTLKKMMTDKYCPRGKIKKLKTKMWELKTKGIDVIGYSRRFQELALMCDRMFPKESDWVEKYIGRLPDTIHDSVKSTKPKTIQEAIEFATELMDKRIHDAVENKRKFEGTSGNNQNQPQ
nr:hypothetical protein [Tanacetum cinerariifolium]